MARLPADNTSDQTMPCPRCKTMHKRDPYVKRPELITKECMNCNGVGQFPAGEDDSEFYDCHQCGGSGEITRNPVGPADVQCDCGALLKHVVPLFCMSQFGWHWEIK